MKAIESDLKFNGYKIKELKYKQYDITPTETINYSIDMNPEIKSQSNSSASLNLSLKISGKQQEKTITELSIVIEGMFSTDKIEEDKFKELIMSNGIVNLITILRSFIASFSSQVGNVSPIIMPLINVQLSINKDEENLKRENQQ